MRIAFVDVLVFRGQGDTLEFLCLRRGPRGRSPGSWEAVHGHIEAEETAVETARRELREEAGVDPLALYNLSRLESFYRHAADEVVLVPVFAARVAAEARVVVSSEHDAFEWLPPAVAAGRMSWPRVRREIADAVTLLGGGDAGPLEDVLRIPASPPGGAPVP